MSRFKKGKVLLPLLIAAIVFAVYLVCWDSMGDSSGSAFSNYLQVLGVNSPAGTGLDSGALQGREKRPVPRRANILMLGLEEGKRTDTIIYISYDRAGGRLYLVFIPRDTYFHERGFDRGDQRKINALFGRKGAKDCMAAISELLCNTPIDYYVTIDYAGVEKIIDAIEGVEIEVPLDMEVGGLNIAKGKQVLKGKEGLQFLRFRKKYPDGDLGRIRAQQEFIKAALKKVKFLEIPKVVSEAFKAIKTNIPFTDMVEYAREFRDGEIKEVSMHILPGVAMKKHIDGSDWSYYFHNPQKVKELIYTIYDVEKRELNRKNRIK